MSGNASTKSVRYGMGERMNAIGQVISMNAEELLAQYQAGNREFPEIKLVDANLQGIQLTGANFQSATFKGVNLTHANLSHSNLQRLVGSQVKLGKANLTDADLRGASLIGSNLILADFTRANLKGANLSRSALQRANFSQAALQRVNLNTADLQDAKLRHARLQGANLSRADLRRSLMTVANLEQANLHNSDLSSADLTGANLRNAELRQANLSRANFQGANLQGANLRWADLSGADLRWADLSGAVMSGATLTGADLTGATLIGTTLVHVDLTRANLSNVDWADADLSGAHMTGAKLYGTNLYGAKLGEVTCRWVDLSLNGDRSQIYTFQTEDMYEFFYRSAPMIHVTLDDALAPDSLSLLANTYRKLARVTPIPAPNITLSRHRTQLSFELKTDRDLFIMAAAGIFPFQDADKTQKSLQTMLEIGSIDAASRAALQQLQDLMPLLQQLRSDIDHPFFQVPTHTQMINTEGQTLTIYRSPQFGKRPVPFFQQEDELKINALPAFSRPPEEQIMGFIQAFRQGLN